jgi:HEPN domain-containing protein
MPPGIKQDLMTVPRDAWSYALFWVDCLDYAYGFDDVVKDASLNSFGLALLRNGDKELRAAISQLLEHRPNSKAAMSSRMAVEIFLKAFLALKTGLSEQAAKLLGHDLNALMAECRRVAPQHDLLKIEADFSVFPAIRERYTGGDIPSPLLWATYEIAQYTGASTVRSFTDRDSRSELQTK